MRRLLKTRKYCTIFVVVLFFWTNVLTCYAAAPDDPGTQEMGKKLNRLKSEKSPYLLQHADHPVDWFPWGPEAFEKALKENKPIFLSIGYSTCHWCHVMARESFADPEVARLMNKAFVCIKVDREERPDIDAVYMSVCQMMTGSCGWPLTIVMTPEKKPFFAGTYFPKESRFGIIGMRDLIPRLHQLWEEEKEQLVEMADRITDVLKEATATALSVEEPGEELLTASYEQLALRFDGKHGGFGEPPWFPSPSRILHLLRQWKRSGDAKALHMAEKTLRAMRQGGIYDHLGFGFHRYSVDAQWLVPHFEKMLYDQALLSMAYVEAFQATSKSEYKNTAEEIFKYVLRDMTSPGGGFYSAEDAESEGEEGKFYLFTLEEILTILGAEEAALFSRVYGIEAEGNFIDPVSGGKPGGNILHLNKPADTLAASAEVTRGELEARLQKAREKLFAAREQRVHPHKDDKILTDWNGLMIAALARGAQAFDTPAYADAAARAADFILKNLHTREGVLLHRYRDGHAAVRAHLDDYAFLVWGLIELYEATFRVEYLRQAMDLNDKMVKHFWDEKNGGFFFSADDAEDLLVRKKEIYDGPLPSGNAVAMLNLLRLGRMTAKPEMEKKAMKTARAFLDNVRRSPHSHTHYMVALHFGFGPSYEVIIAGTPGAKDTRAMLKPLRERFLPEKIVLFRPSGKDVPEISGIAAFTEYQKAIGGKATAYVCIRYNCRFPTTDVVKMLELLGIKE